MHLLEVRPEDDFIHELAPNSPYSTINSYYFAFFIPERGLKANLYTFMHPVLGVCSAGPTLFQGRNMTAAHCLHAGFHGFMPVPQVGARKLSFPNGFALEILEPLHKHRATYLSKEADVSFDVLFTAISPAFARDHVLPGEWSGQHRELGPGGLEQAMRVEGELRLHGDTLQVRSFCLRDRSWRQNRSEDEVDTPPYGWMTIVDDDFAFCLSGVDDPEMTPWKDMYALPEAASLRYGWVWEKKTGIRKIVRARRVVSRERNVLYTTRHSVTATDDDGRAYEFSGETLATAFIPPWPTLGYTDNMVRWTCVKSGKQFHNCYQEVFWSKFLRRVGAASD